MAGKVTLEIRGADGIVVTDVHIENDEQFDFLKELITNVNEIDTPIIRMFDGEDMHS